MPDSARMHRFRKIVVGLEGTDSDVALIRYADLVSKLRTAEEIRFVHVQPTEAAGAEPQRLSDDRTRGARWRPSVAPRPATASCPRAGKRVPSLLGRQPHRGGWGTPRPAYRPNGPGTLRNLLAAYSYVSPSRHSPHET